MCTPVLFKIVLRGGRMPFEAIASSEAFFFGGRFSFTASDRSSSDKGYTSFGLIFKGGWENVV